MSKRTTVGGSNERSHIFQCYIIILVTSSATDFTVLSSDREFLYYRRKNNFLRSGESSGDTNVSMCLIVIYIYVNSFMFMHNGLNIFCFAKTIAHFLVDYTRSIKLSAFTTPICIIHPLYTQHLLSELDSNAFKLS